MNSVSTKLSYLKNGSTEYTELKNLQTVPAFMGETTTIDETTLADTFERKRPGIKSYGDGLPFTFLYDAEQEDSTFNIVAQMKDTDIHHWKITLPDGTEFTFTAFANVTTNEIEVNKPITFTLTLFAQSAIEIGEKAQTEA